MNIRKEELLTAASQAGIANEQAETLWNTLLKQSENKSTFTFDLPHVLYYLGALIVLSALGWFMGTGWEKFGGSGIMAISLAYALLFVIVGNFLWRREKFKSGGGIFITLAVAMTPLAIYGFEQMTGWWVRGPPGGYKDFFGLIKGGWLLMEVGTIFAGIIALYFYRFPLLCAPIFFSLWFMSMDAAPVILGIEYSYTSALSVSLWFGVALLVISYLVDQRTRQDFAFWGYLFGLLAFWGGLSLMDSPSELNKFMYCVINLGLILVSILLQRKVFIIFGTVGVLAYIGSLSWRLFYDSALFPFVLSAIGIAIIALGIAYRNNQKKIEDAILNFVAETLKNVLPQNRK